MRLYWSVVFAAMMVTVMTGQNAAPNGLTDNPVYKKNCAKCHGKTAEGRHFGGPSLVSGKTEAMSADELREIITNGKGRMPKYANKLTSEQIDELVKEIQAVKQK